MSLFKSNLLSLSKVRLKEAKILFDNECYSGAYYLVGYSVELGLKAKISESFFRDCIPDKNFVNKIYTHKLTDLLDYADIQKTFNESCRNNNDLKLNWDIIIKWSEVSRYQTFDALQASSLINAIDNPKNGFNQWLRTL